MLLPLPTQPLDLLLSMAAGDQPHIHFSSLVATQTPPVPSATSWDPTVIAATIGAVAAVVAALFATGVAIYQTRQSRKIEREKNEQQRRHDQERDEIQRRHEQEMERFRRELDVQYREKEQEKQREEATRREMLMAQNNVTRAIAYRKALHLDPLYLTYSDSRHATSLRSGKYLCARTCARRHRRALCYRPRSCYCSRATRP